MTKPGKIEAKSKESKISIPKEWTFKSAELAAGFDAHVREQLPFYDLATGVVAHLGRCYIPNGGLVIDVGASTGNIGRALAEVIKIRNADFLAIESSQEMAACYQGPGGVLVGDAEAYDFENAQPDFIVCFLSLMFIPIKSRLTLITRMKASLRSGGALVIFDKTAPQAGYLGTVAYRLALSAKQKNGASAEEIIAKELSISGLQRPIDAGELVGFQEIFRFGDFFGAVYEAHPAMLNWDLRGPLKISKL